MSSRTAVDVMLADLTFPGYMEPLHALARAFERRHPDYEIRLKGVRYANMPAEVRSAAAQGRPPAVAEYYYSLTQDARDAVAVDGTALFTSVERAVAGRSSVLDEPVILNDLIAPARAYYSQDGDCRSLPTVITTALLYTNKTLFNRLGLTDLPRTWSELEAACAQIAIHPEAPPYGVTWANHGILFQQAVGTQDGLLVDHGNGRFARAEKVDLSSKQLLTWVRWWEHMYRQGHYLYTGEVADWAGTLRAFAEQQVVFRLSSSNDVGFTASAAERAGFEFETSALPYNDEAPYAGNVIAGSSLWLTGGLSKAVEDGALAFMQFLGNPRNAADWHQITSFVPATRSAYDLLTEEGWFDLHPYHRAASEQLDAAHHPPISLGAVMGNFDLIQELMPQAMADVLLRAAEPARRFAQATVQAQLLLEDYNTRCRVNHTVAG